MRKYASKQVLSKLNFIDDSFLLNRTISKNNFDLFYLFRTLIWMDGSNKFTYPSIPQQRPEPKKKNTLKMWRREVIQINCFISGEISSFQATKKSIIQKKYKNEALKTINSWKRTGNKNEKENCVDKQMKRLFYYSVLGTHSHSIKCIQN